MKITDPYSLTARAKASAKPVRMAGASIGTITRRIVCQRLAPRAADTPSLLRSSSPISGRTGRPGNGRATETRAIRSPARPHGTLPLEPEAGETPADGSMGSVQRRQRKAGDRGRRGERQIDRGVKQPAAREVISRQHPGDQQSEHGVDQGRRKREAETRPQRRKDTWF